MQPLRTSAPAAQRGSNFPSCSSIMRSSSSRKCLCILIVLAVLQLIQSYSIRSSPAKHNLRVQAKLSNTHYRNTGRSGLKLFLSASDVWTEKSPAWKSVVSTNADLNEAINEIIASVSLNNEVNVGKYNLAIFFTSSIYEASAFKYDELFETLSKSMPAMKTMIGCTTGKTSNNHKEITCVFSDCHDMPCISVCTARMNSLMMPRKISHSCKFL